MKEERLYADETQKKRLRSIINDFIEFVVLFSNR